MALHRLLKRKNGKGPRKIYPSKSNVKIWHVSLEMRILNCQIFYEMAMKKITILSIMILVLVSCGSSDLKSARDINKILDEMMANKAFQIASSWAEPQVTLAMQQLDNAGLFPAGSTAGHIDISSTVNYLKMENDSVRAYLPFYGERQFGGGYNNSEGIAFEGIPNDLQIEKGKKDAYDIRFNIRDKNSSVERYQVYIKLFPNLTTAITVNSNQRYSIRYKGNATKLPIEN